MPMNWRRGASTWWRRRHSGRRRRPRKDGSRSWSAGRKPRAAKILRADAAGAAQAASAIADYLRSARLLAASEAIRLGQRFGFEPATVLDLSDQLGGGDLDATLRRDVVTRRFETGVQLGLVRRNLDLAARLAVATDTRSPLIDATLAAWSAAERKLGYGADHSSIIKWLETLPSLKPAPEQEPKPETAGSAPTV